MKKLITLGFAAVAAGMTFAAANDLLITFSTPGPDTYADGTTVLDGERYALCWSQDFSKFSIKADGTAEGGEIILKAPVAKDGRCPTTVFEIDAAYAAAKNFASGSWSVFLLDTRNFGKNAVNTVGQVGGSVTVGSGTVATLTGTKAATSALAVGADDPQPEITGIRIVDGNVYVTIKCAPYLAYGLVEGATPDAVTDTVKEAYRDEAATTVEEITIVTPAKEGGAFLKVKRN
jgi:hypothetical protein